MAIAAEVDADGGVNVRIDVEGFRFAPELVDQAHTPGAGHAHIYVDGEKLGRVFDSEYHIANLSPGRHEVRVSLNTNDHSELTYDGKLLEATATVSVPEVGQGRDSGGHDAGSKNGRAEHHHAGHHHGDPGATEGVVVAEVHLGNLEVYP